MVELRKDPKGEKIFSKTSMNPTGPLDVPVKSDEVDTLRKRIKDLEMELKEREASGFDIWGGALRDFSLKFIYAIVASESVYVATIW